MTRIDEINDLSREIEKLKVKIVEKQRELKRFEYDQKMMGKREHYKKLVAAGKVIERVGILYTYSEHELYLLLMEHREALCPKI